MSAASQTADIAVLKTEVGHIKEIVERNQRDGEAARADIKKDIADLKANFGTSIEALKVDLNERKGAEKWANALRMGISGSLGGGIGAAIAKAASYMGSVPLK